MDDQRTGGEGGGSINRNLKILLWLFLGVMLSITVSDLLAVFVLHIKQK